MGTFWSDPQSQPKRRYRWIMIIGGIPQWIIKKVNKPSFEVTSAEHKYLNHTFYYPGRVQYDTVSCTLVDPISPDATRTMMNLLGASGYTITDDASDLQTISKLNATSAIGSVTIQQLNNEGAAIEIFTLMNPWMTKVNFGDLDYEGD